MKIEVLGKPIDRKDGNEKVSGLAKYAADFTPAGFVYAFPCRSAIASGVIANIETRDAERAAGVLQVITHKNASRFKAFALPNQIDLLRMGSLLGENILPLQDNKVSYFGQYIGLVVAETYEQARFAADLIQVRYERSSISIDLVTELRKATQPRINSFGDPVQLNPGKTQGPLASSPAKVESTYTTRSENHHPMEPHATVAHWTAEDKLVLYDSTQGVKGVQTAISYLFDLPRENVKVVCPFVGGGFGSKGSQWPHILLSVMAAKRIGRPVKLVLTRQMMVTNVGHRPETRQSVTLGADTRGKLRAIRHVNESYQGFSRYFEESGIQTQTLYAADEREITYNITKLNINSPSFMRAPGEAPGTFALESAMDELAIELNIDPIELRIRNHSSTHPVSGLPFSGENLKQCYEIGMRKFGWMKRSVKPRTRRDGRYLVGYGMASATYPATRSAASVKVCLYADGRVEVFSATQDLGTGTYTIIAQTLADAIGVSVESISVQIGDSSFPSAPVSGGSTTAASVTAAVLAAGETLRADLMTLALSDTRSRLYGRGQDEVGFANARFFIKNDLSKVDKFSDILKRRAKDRVESCATSVPQGGGGLERNAPPCTVSSYAADQNSDSTKYAFHSFGAQFAEVRVDEDLGTVRVSRFVSVQDVGRVLNPKTARSQIIGGVTFGLGQALTEQTVYDKRWANPVHRHFGDYHIPVHFDVPPIEVYFIGKPDPHISSLGARGLGEIGGCGVAAAVANAVYNATGIRIRDLPITPDKLI